MTQHQQIDDETLIAFLQGTLSEAQSLLIEQAINENTALAARAEQLSSDDPVIARAFQQVLSESLPRHLEDAVWQGATQKTTADVVALPQHNRNKGYLPMAAAASIALVIGGLLGQQFTEDTSNNHSLTQADAGLIVAQNPLYVALEQTTSQQHFAAGNGDIIQPIMSFQANDGRHCREFQINTDSKVSIGVACKQDGYWNTEILLAAGNRPTGSQQYQPAAGYSQAALDAVLDTLWDGVAFDLNEEQALIQQGWP